MKRYYMRAGMSPLDNFSPFDTFMKDSIGGNSGNMLFAYSMFRALTTTNSCVDVNNYKLDIKKCEEINEKYSAFVIPLADAFRPNWKEMEKLIPFIKALKIPCIVSGVGVSMTYEPDFSKNYVFDESAKEFCKVVLEKSASIGVRGEITAKYLEKLGFKNHIRIIGCPSMFAKGGTIGYSDIEDLTYGSKMSFNAAKGCPANVWKFLENSFKYFKEYYFLPQGFYDLKLLYAGVTSELGGIDYPCDNMHFLIQEDRMRFFVNVPSWIEFLSKLDFSLGIKIHGTVAAILAGTPAFLFAIDSRTRELAEYHNIPHMNAADVTEIMTPYSIYNNTDFSKIKQGHKERFRNFIDFLEENNLENIYTNKEEAIFDEQLKKIQFEPGIRSILHVDSQQTGERLNLFMGHINRKIEKLQK